MRTVRCSGPVRGCTARQGTIAYGMGLAALVSLRAALSAGTAAAHPLAPSLLQLEQAASGEADVLWKTPLMRVPGSELTPVLPAHCRPLGRPEAREEGTAMIARWTMDCGERDLVGSRIEVTGIAGSKTDVLLRVALADGRSFRQVLTTDSPFFDKIETLGFIASPTRTHSWSLAALSVKAR